ncbi:hypothetical protein CDL12_19511 [Handroanthus impetiginosus]|uniref:Uncharacterized protein n=1 Tax=Handroanthus impetiginosus TaxID=429701 RepID=A0A2G9GRL3_9LAMI|nr:hypothetical protein CDL12_19511 [Handroanthus impetiginosus]
MMRTLFPNLEREDALETVLEVPVPEEMFVSNHKQKSWRNIMSWGVIKRPHVENPGAREMEIQLLLGVVAAPLIPVPIRCDRTITDHQMKGCPIESSMAKYIVQQYIAAAGGEHALNSINSMYAMGKVKMTASEFVSGQDNSSLNNSNNKIKNLKNMKGELGGFVLWQKKPDLWSFELMVSGYKISAGSDGKVAWRQTPWHHSHASRGPPRPLRRSLQGLDPRSTANLFSNSICIGEKNINNEDCFVLKIEADSSSLKARSSNSVEIIRHTVWGCFSQKTGLLVQLEDSHLLRINDVFWETTMDSYIKDYKTINGVNIAHSGRTSVCLIRMGENSDSHSKTRMEEIWDVEEMDFNVKGLSTDCFLPPGDLEDEECGVIINGDVMKNRGLRFKILDNYSRILDNYSRICAGKSGIRVVAIDEDNLELFGIDEEL